MKLNFLNPRQETLYQLWIPHGVGKKRDTWVMKDQRPFDTDTLGKLLAKIGIRLDKEKKKWEARSNYVSIKFCCAWCELLIDVICSLKLFGVLWKHAIHSLDENSFKMLTSRYAQLKPYDLKPVVEAFLPYVDAIGKADKRREISISMSRARVECLESRIEALHKLFSWKMPCAKFPNNTKVQAFLRGPVRSWR
ncbi:unnamed protein product [Phytophthora lilii]|uniref:Unnamed protein product n=1 Tax=Phytophthora lilii TaxID=2077276 RepID=A0A9W6WNT1_9STRA|nr:unnamed protein product [Phytophthora lilii]